MVTQSHEVKGRGFHHLLAPLFVFLAAGVVVAGSLYYQSQMQRWTVLLMGVLFFGAGASAGLIWRRQRTQFHKERSNGAEALAASETRYRRLFETAKDGILILDAKTGVVVDVNPFLIEMLGLPLETFLGKKIWELGFFKDVAASQANFAELLEKEYVRYDDLPLETADGRRVEVEFVSNVYQVDHEKVIQCNIRNITERKRVEEALAASETRYRRLFETAKDGILILDAKTGMVVDVNPFLIEMLGLPLETFLGKKIWELESFKDIAPNQDSFAELRRREYVRYDDMPLETADGRRVEVEFVSSIYQVDHQKVIQCNIRDVTERKRAVEALRRGETQIHTILESTIDGILAVDNQGKVIKANRRFADLWRIPQSLIEGGDDKTLLDFVLSQLSDPGTFLKKVQVLYKSDTVDIDTLAFKDGRVFERYSSPMIMEGDVIGRVWSFRDITEQRRLQQKLLQSRKMEAIGQLTAGIAHEFNNLLAAILGYSNLVLARLPSDSPLRRDLEQMEMAGNRAAALTRQLLTFGRKCPQELKPINLNTIVLNMQRMLEPLLGSTVHLTTSLDPALGIVIADPAQIGQIIMNMVVNARDAMPYGGALTITTTNVRFDKDMARRHPESVPGSYIRLTVSDTGVGMSDEVKAKLFDPFFTTKAVGQGTGLGLATCIGIIKQTGGFIDVDSAPGKGTAFQVFLPQADAAAMAIAVAGATQPSANDSGHC